MTLLSKLYCILTTPKHQPEDDYKVIITEMFVKVEHPNWDFGSVEWRDLHTVMLVNTDEGPWLPDIWLTLIGNKSKCRIPQGAKGFEEVYEIVSKYGGFDYENAGKSVSCTDNVEFVLWRKQ